VLALLSGIAPFKSASATHLCTMECCAGLAPHAAGTCHMSMSPRSTKEGENLPEPQPDTHCGISNGDNGTIEGVTGGVMGMTTIADPYQEIDGVTIDADDHCNTDSRAKDLSAPSHNNYSQPASIETQSFSKPCPPECGTGALSSGVRPTRHSVALAYNARPRPPTLSRKGQHSNSSLLVTSTYGKQLRPRGPPLAFS
jgi:hypothetical protein